MPICLSPGSTARYHPWVLDLSSKEGRKIFKVQDREITEGRLDDLSADDGGSWNLVQFLLGPDTFCTVRWPNIAFAGAADAKPSTGGPNESFHEDAAVVVATTVIDATFRAGQACEHAEPKE